MRWTWLAIAAACDEDPACEWELPPPDVLGACSAVLGYYADDGACRSVSGCGCAEPDCEPVPFASEEECVAACGR